MATILPQTNIEITDTKAASVMDIPSRTYKLNITEKEKQLCPYQLEYIESTGTQYIDTDYTMKDNERLEITFALTVAPQSYGYGGAAGLLHNINPRPILKVRTVYNGRGKLIGTTSSGGGSGGEIIQYEVSFPTPDTNMHTLKYATDDSGLFFDDVQYTSQYTINSKLKFRLFTSDINTPKEYIKAKLYSLKVINTQTSAVTFELLPALYHDRPCLFDNVSKTFYYNNGTGEFEHGDVIGFIVPGDCPISNINNGYYYPDTINGFVDKRDAVKQAVYHILMTERYAYLIYSNNYGVELEQYIGKDFNYLEATIERTLKDALTYDLRIKDVEVTEITNKGDCALIKFNVYSIYGDIPMEVNISV